LVDNSGTVKIIDLGFGKQIRATKDFDKSLSLNWWCAVPKEFGLGLYDFSTEVYFVGKLFEEMIADFNLSQFSHTDTLRKMCAYDNKLRFKSFDEVRLGLSSHQTNEINFDKNDAELAKAFLITHHSQPF